MLKEKISNNYPWELWNKMVEHGGFRKTEVGKIPKNWEVVRLGDVIQEIKNGFASGKRDENGVVQIRMNNVSTNGKLLFNSYLKVPAPESLDQWLLRNGDFLFNNTNSYDLVGKSTVFDDAPFPCTFSNHFTRIRFKKEVVLPKLILYHFVVLWGKGYFKSVAIRHVGQSAVHTDYLLKLQLPLPPLPEQKKIAEILSTVDEAIEKVDEAIEKTQRLKKGLMQELLTKGWGRGKQGWRIENGEGRRGKQEWRRENEEWRFKETEIGRIPKEWEVVKLAQVGNIITGTTPSTNNKDFWGEGYPFVTPTDFTEEKYVHKTERSVTKSGAERGRIIPKNSIMVVCIASVGEVSMASAECITNQQINTLVCNKEINPHYLYYEMIFSKNRLKRWAGITTSPIIKKSLFEKFPIPLPHLSEQKKIAEILSTVDKRLELLRSRKERLERVKKGLMDDLLTGKVRVTNLIS